MLTFSSRIPCYKRPQNYGYHSAANFRNTKYGNTLLPHTVYPVLKAFQKHSFRLQGWGEVRKWKRICDKVSGYTHQTYKKSFAHNVLDDDGLGRRKGLGGGLVRWHVGLTPDGYGTRDIPTRIN